MEPTGRSLYQPLEQSQRQFRLLRLPGTDTNGTRCEVKSFSSLNDDIPPYKALSYRWGDDIPDFTIYLNDHPVRVRKGLQAFIKQMIYEERRDWYFIDALCIDQDNQLERACQVQQMGEIYRRAEEVVVWIMHEPYHYERDETHWRRVVYDPENAMDDILPFFTASLERGVLENSYWSRLWIVQEVLLAKRLTIRLGRAEVEWTNLLPKESNLKYRGLPARNKKIGSVWHHGTEPWANKITAQNILSYRYFKTRSLRAGNHLPFHKAVEFFALQRCGTPHDMVFGYLGLTNSHIQIDYSMPILDLFVATLSDWLLSAGFVRQDLKGLRGKRIASEIVEANEITAPLQAFGLDPCEPVVHLLVREVIGFFAPGFEESLTNEITTEWSYLHRWRGSKQLSETVLSFEHKSKLKSVYRNIKLLKIVATEMRVSSAKKKEIAARQKAMKEKDAVMSGPGESDESKTYSQWAAHARAISEQIWQRFRESGHDAEGVMKDESWTLTA